MRRRCSLLLLVLLAALLPSAALAHSHGQNLDRDHDHKLTRTVPADYGARGALRDSDVSLAEALTYALQESYLSLARHEAVMAKFGIRRPFSQAHLAEQQHIQVLRGLLRRHNLPVSPNRAAALVSAPRSLKGAYQAAVKGETEKVAMYEKLGNLPALPEEVRRTMHRLGADARRHLEAFRTGLGRVK